jgi:hypothetical protein
MFEYSLLRKPFHELGFDDVTATFKGNVIFAWM